MGDERPVAEFVKVGEVAGATTTAHSHDHSHDHGHTHEVLDSPGEKERGGF